MIKIDGVTYNIPVVSLQRKGEFLDKYANRTESGDLERELIGVYFNYQLKFGFTTDYQEYARLWDKLTEPVEFHQVTVPVGAGEYTFQAYFSNVGDELIRQHNGIAYYGGLTVNYTAKAPARR